MSYASLLTHPLVIVTPEDVDPDVVDDYGQPIRTTSSANVRGLVQPKATQGSAREAAATHQAGVEISTHVIFLPLMTIGQGAWITDDPPNGRRFDVTGVRSHEYGTVPHLEIEAILVGSTEGPAAGS